MSGGITNYGFYGGLGTPLTSFGFVVVDDGLVNVCMETGSNGLVYGYDSSIPIGTPSKSYTTDGQFIYAMSWDSLGDFHFKFGIAGDEQISNVVSLLVANASGDRVASWDTTTLSYTFFDLDLANTLISNFNVGNTTQCYYVTIYEGLLIHYLYTDVLVGV